MTVVAPRGPTICLVSHRRSPRQQREERVGCEAEFVTDPPFCVRWYQWSQVPYEWALQEAGFRDFVWYPSEVAPEDVARYGEVYWRNFYDNCPIIGLVC